MDVNDEDYGESIKKWITFFMSCNLLFWHNFLPGNQLKMILCTQGHVGHHGGSRHQGQGAEPESPPLIL